MRALALEHLRPDPVGVFGEVLMERGIVVDRILLHEGEAEPDWRRYDLIVAMGAGVSVWQEEGFPLIVTAGGTRPARRVSLTERLSPRGLAIALVAGEGSTAPEISERLFLGPHTVELQLASAAIKLGLHSPDRLTEVLRRETQARPAPRRRVQADVRR